MNNDHQIEQLLSESSFLKKALVKVSFAAIGIHQNLDKELQKLRLLVKSNDDIKDIQKQVEAITKVLIEIDDNHENEPTLSTTELLEYLNKQLSNEFPELKKRFKSIIKHSEERPLFKTLQKYNVLLPQQTEKKSNFLKRLFSSKKSKSKELNQDEIHNIQRTLFVFMDQLSAPESFENKITAVVEQIENLQSSNSLHGIMETISSLVLEIKSEDKKHFELFLNQLNQRLDIVQQILTSHSSAQNEEQQAHQKMNESVRAEVGNLNQEISKSEDIDQLQQIVAHRLESMITNLDDYKSAHDHFIKNNLDKMNLLNKQLNHSRTDINQLTDQLQKQQHIAETDSLTKLPNRYAFQKKIHEESIRWRRYRNPLSLAMVDIDHFKKVNDTFGHVCGDDVLLQLATILKNESRETDFVARYGGEEFIIILPETHINHATKAINIIRQKIASTAFVLNEEKRNITVSVGVAEFEDDDAIESVINRADIALYRAKEKGRNNVCCEIKS